MDQREYSIKTAVILPGYKEIVMAGELSIQNAKAIHLQLVQSLSDCVTIKMIFDDVTKIDLSVLQLIVSFYKSCVVRKINVSFDFQRLPEAIISVIKKNGFAEIFDIAKANA
jgi:anti-anti-sigma regulatory factor